MKHKGQTGQEGIALLTATIFIAMAVLVLAALTVRVTNQNSQVAQYTNFRECFQGIEAGLAQSKVDLEAGGTGMIGLSGQATLPPTDASYVEPEFDGQGVSPLTIPTMPRVEYYAYAQDWANDGIDNNGDGTVDGTDEDFVYTVFASARNGGVTRQAEVVLAGFDVNVWRNAVFGGTGQAGGLINGNVSIHGSVHLLGNNLPVGATAVEALDLSGASLIHNNYVGMPAAYVTRVPALSQTLHNGELVESLDAKLRVKKGLVGMSGNSEIGEPNVAGNSIKETMDGTYVTDGWTGNSVIDDGGRGDPTRLWSDNGWDEGYDLGDKVPLPILSDDWRDMYTGAKMVNPATGTWYTHEEYFSQVLANPAYPGDILIKANTDFYYNASRPSDPDPANLQPNDNYILFNSATKVMKINGQIEIDGNLEITRGGGNEKTIYYTGRAAILVRGNVTLNTDLYTINSDGTAANSFPANNVIGIMAEQDMTIGTLSQLYLMGAFYAQGKIASSKQTIVAGTFVSNYFDMGTNVPDIYQIPTLADHLPFGMIGAYPILVFSQVSWRELGV